MTNKKTAGTRSLARADSQRRHYSNGLITTGRKPA